MTRRQRLALFFNILVLSTAASVISQTSATSSTAETKSLPAPTNLQALPKDTSAAKLDQIMHGYEQQLGVPCAYCHEQDFQTKKINYASDENPVKLTARMMISMTADINNKYLARLGDRRYAEPITCGNCHQGIVSPPTFEPKPAGAKQ